MLHSVSMLIVYTGNGKGKTTAALGAALRAVGEGQRVLMVQFIKGPWVSGEDEAYKRLAPDLQIVKKGKGFVGILGDALPREEHQRAAEEGLEYALAEGQSGQWQMLILDEVNNAMHLGLLTESAVLQAVERLLPRLNNLILTGRDAPAKILERADLVTEMKEVKHPYNEGVVGKKGLEY